MFPTEENLYLLTDAAMALKVDPNTLDTTDEVGNLTYVLYYFISSHCYSSHVILLVYKQALPKQSILLKYVHIQEK